MTHPNFDRTRPHRRLRSRGLSLIAMLAAVLTLLAWPALAVDQKHLEDDEAYDTSSSASYSYLRLVDGDATLLQDGTERDRAEANQPLLTGDRLFLSRRTRVEVVLSDRSLVRLDSESDLGFEALGSSPDGDADSTVLDLNAGEMQLIVPEDLLAEFYPRVETPNATVYVQAAGSYWIHSHRDGITELVVREGFAEVVTSRGSTIVRADEEVRIEGEGLVRTDLFDARSYTSLERWGSRLDRDAEQADGYVEGPLRYSAASLSGHGSWISVGSRRAWQPRVSAGWRPYYSGRWASTPSGLTWVSYEPWGWVPYHYGSWDYADHYGWVWYPGYRYAPAWVYWYYGPSYAAWCPTGYYSSYYTRHYGRGTYTPVLGWGTYGWAGGRRSNFDRWNFVDYGNLGGRQQARFTRPGSTFREGLRDGELPRGIITTDTRGLRPDRIRQPGEAIEVLRTRPTPRGKPSAAELPDVTSFVARQPLAGEAEGRIITARKPRIDGGPTAQVGAIEGPALRPDKPAVSARPSVRNTAPGIARGPAVRESGPAAGHKPVAVTPRAEQGPAVRPRTEGVRPNPGAPAPQASGNPPAVRKPAVRKPSAGEAAPEKPAPREPTTDSKPSVQPRSGSESGAQSRPSVKPRATPKPKPKDPPAQLSVPAPAVRSSAPSNRVRVDDRPAVAPRPQGRYPAAPRTSASGTPRTQPTPGASQRYASPSPQVRTGDTAARQPAPRAGNSAPRAGNSAPRAGASAPRTVNKPRAVNQAPSRAPSSQPRASSAKPSPSRPSVRSSGSNQGGGSSGSKASAGGTQSNSRPSSGGAARSTRSSGGKAKAKDGGGKRGSGDKP